jgi:hypothetical protein
MLHIGLMKTIQADRERAFRDARFRYEARLMTAAGDGPRPLSGSDGRVPLDDRPSHRGNLRPDLGGR